MFEHLQFADPNQCQRLFHGRGHAYPGFEHINVDWLSPVFLITLYQEHDPAFLEQLAQHLKALHPDCQSVLVQHRWQKHAPILPILGEMIEHTVVQEGELKFHIELGKVQNTGLFLDMRNGRQWVKDHVQDKSVLNLFSYTCAFSVAALAGGAERVVNIDMSKASLSKGRENHRLNAQDTNRVMFQGVDIFKSFGRIKKHGPYDLVIADPPSFQKGSVNIQKDYGKIIRRLPQWLKPKGMALLCLNSPDLDEAFLFEQVANECPECQFVERVDAPSVFKEAHQGKGLKVLAFQFQPKVV